MGIVERIEVPVGMSVRNVEIDAEDLNIGVVSSKVITYKQLTIVIVETSDGVVTSASTAPWPNQRVNPRFSMLKAKQMALDRLATLRKMSAAWQAHSTS